MTTTAVEALRSDHDALAGMAATFTDQDWAAPSACAGWAVRDVVGHLNQLFRQVVDPNALPPADPSGATERTNDRQVEALRHLPVAQLLADYRALGDQAIDALAGLQGNDTPFDLGDLGTHPLHLIANAFAFDHYTHIRADLLAPAGPLARDVPPTDERHLAATADWIVAGIPQMSPAAVAAPIALVLTGLAGRTAHFGPDTTAVATVSCTIADLALWSTGRRPWRDLEVELSGDTVAGEHFCDNIHVF